MIEKAFSLTAEELLKRLESRRDGLTSEEARERLARVGPNQLKEAKKINPLSLFIKQFKNLFTLILSFAIVTSIAITIWGKENRIPETIFIFAIILKKF